MPIFRKDHRSQLTHITFDYGKKTYKFLSDEAIPYIEKWKETSDKASLLFKRVVISRTLVYVNEQYQFFHELSTWQGKGPFTAEQVLEMVRFDPLLSQQAWNDRLHKYNPLKIENSV